MIKKIYLVQIALFFSVFTSNAQITQAWLWAKEQSLGGTGGGSDAALAVCTDRAGNSYVTGYFNSNQITFGSHFAGNYQSGKRDIFVVKYDPTGVAQWVKSAGGTENDNGIAIAVDTLGSVYVTGTFSGGFMWFGTTSLTNRGATTTTDIFVAKLSASTGSLIWLKQQGNTGNDACNGVAADPSGKIYITGSFETSIALGTTTLTATGAGVCPFIAGCDTSGNPKWAVSSTASGDIGEGSGIVADDKGNLFVSGVFSSTTIDFGASFHAVGAGTSVQSGKDIFILKCDTANGTTLLMNYINGKYDKIPKGMCMDKTGNVYLGGYYYADMNFGGGINWPVPTFFNYEVFTVKYNSSLTPLWARNGVNSNDNDYGFGVGVDGGGNVYVTGYYYSNTLTFGSTTINNSTGGTGKADMFLAKYNSAGTVTWVQNLGAASNNDGATALATDTAGNVITVGFTESASMSFNTHTISNASVSIARPFAAKLNTGMCTLPTQPTAIIGSSNACINVPISYSVAPTAGATSYSWTVPANWTGTSTTNTITATPPGFAFTGAFSVVASNTCGVSPPTTLTVTVNTQPTISASSIPATGSVCAGSNATLIGGGGVSYTWSGGVTNNTAFSVTVTAVYTVTGTDANGCQNTATKTITMKPLPTVTASVSPTATICAGNSVTLMGGGASTYTWTGGVTNNVAFTPTITATYTVTGTGSNGCKNTATQMVTVNGCAGIYQSANNNLAIYPNPFTSVVTLSGVEEFTRLSVCNVIGETVYQSQIRSGTAVIDLSNERSGVYYVQLKNENGIVTKKIIKQ